MSVDRTMTMFRTIRYVVNGPKLADPELQRPLKKEVTDRMAIAMQRVSEAAFIELYGYTPPQRTLDLRPRPSGFYNEVIL